MKNPNRQRGRSTALLLALFCLMGGLAQAFADEGELDISAADAAKQAQQAASLDASENQDETASKSQAESEVAEAAAGDAQAPAGEGVAPQGDLAASANESATTAVEPEPEPPAPFEMLGSEVAPGETRRLSWVASESFSGISVPTPVLVSHGTKTGPTLCLTAAIHGDELNGIEMVRRVLYGLDPENLTGTVIGVPIVNLFGFRRSSRYLPDRRDLNRYFPGDARGSSASRIAHAFFESVISHCDFLVDLHTGSFHRTNLPQLRADLSHPEVLKLTQGFGATAVLRSEGQVGTLRRAATDAGIPAVTLEAGEPTRFQPDEVAHGVKGIRTLLNKLGMLKRVSLWGDPQPVYYSSEWVRADSGGILFSRVNLGDEVEKGQVLGTVTDPITNHRTAIHAPVRGRILGMALNQVVIPGFASFRIGIEKSSEEVVKEAVQVPDDSQVETQDTPKDKPGSASASKTQVTPAPLNGSRSKLEVPKASKDGVEDERPD